MTRKKVKDLIDLSKPIGYWNEMGGVVVYNIEDTADGIYFYIKVGIQGSNPTYHRVKLWMLGMDGRHRDNIHVGNRRLYIDECLRVF